jgi:hypothetical protein
MMLDASDGRLLEGFEKLLGRIMVPALRNQKVLNALRYVLSEFTVWYFN